MKLEDEHAERMAVINRAAHEALRQVLGSPVEARRWGEVPASETLNVPCLVTGGSEGVFLGRIAGHHDPAARTVPVMLSLTSAYSAVVPLDGVWLLRRVRS